MRNLFTPHDRCFVSTILASRVRDDALAGVCGTRAN